MSSEENVPTKEEEKMSNEKLPAVLSDSKKQPIIPSKPKDEPVRGMKKWLCSAKAAIGSATTQKEIKKEIVTPASVPQEQEREDTEEEKERPADGEEGTEQEEISENEEEEIAENEEDRARGRRAVDRLCSSKVHSAHVFEEGQVIYDVTLNQTNIGSNANKSYILQLIEDNDKAEYSVWFRWGRVGYPGQNKLLAFRGNLKKAKIVFGKKFFEKTRNKWPTSFEDFKPAPGKYTMIGQQRVKVGRECLDKIGTFIDQENFGVEHLDANNTYYSIIPHANGFKQPERIRSHEKIEREKKALRSIENGSIDINKTPVSTSKKDADRIWSIFKIQSPRTDVDSAPTTVETPPAADITPKRPTAAVIKKRKMDSGGSSEEMTMDGESSRLASAEKKRKSHL